jgi:5-formyltetrahydrofolate cyclo-ligase
LDEKRRLREAMQAARREHVAQLPDSTRALLFLRPPGAIATLAPEGSSVGLYHARAVEAPTRGWARWFFENGRTIALPWFADRDAPMRFKAWRDPFEDADLETGPFGLQPANDADDVMPSLVVVPLLAFTPQCERLGQGGGHFDRWLTDHPDTRPIGLAWDAQAVDALPLEPHDRRLHAVVTPTRLFEGAA